MAKAFEDALRSLKVIENDSPQYVAQTILEVPLHDKPEKKKGTSSLGTAQSEEDEDWLDITINPFNDNA